MCVVLPGLFHTSPGLPFRAPLKWPWPPSLQPFEAALKLLSPRAAEHLIVRATVPCLWLLGCSCDGSGCVFDECSMWLIVHSFLSCIQIIFIYMLNFAQKQQESVMRLKTKPESRSSIYRAMFFWNLLPDFVPGPLCYSSRSGDPSGVPKGTPR